MIYRFKPTFFAAIQQAVGREIPFPLFSRWARKTIPLIAAVYKAADDAGLDATQRRAIVLRIDRRDTSMETILGGIKYHAEREYPYLLGEKVADNAVAVYALNLNDRYRLLRLTELETVATGPLGQALDRLRQHLDSAPSTPS
jgi:hypothetical protein